MSFSRSFQPPQGMFLNKLFFIILQYTPFRQSPVAHVNPIKNKNIKWIEDSFGIITLEITRNGLFDKIAQKTFKVPPKSYIKLDKHGSFVWKCIDDNKSVYELSKDVKGHFGNDAEPLIERLVEFITILESNKFVKFKKGGK